MFLGNTGIFSFPFLSDSLLRFYSAPQLLHSTTISQSLIFTLAAPSLSFNAAHLRRGRTKLAVIASRSLNPFPFSCVKSNEERITPTRLPSGAHAPSQFSPLLSLFLFPPKLYIYARRGRTGVRKPPSSTPHEDLVYWGKCTSHFPRVTHSTSSANNIPTHIQSPKTVTRTTHSQIAACRAGSLFP